MRYAFQYLKQSVFLCTLLWVCFSISNTWARPSPPRAFDDAIFSQLDYGLYWFGRDQTYRKAIPGDTNPYFNPYAPTVIYIHGWEVGETQRHYREVFDYGFIGGPKENLANAWLDDGWNVGVFYWNQFSDEILPHKAEAKVWTHQSLAKMRWRDNQGKLHYNAPEKNASELLFDAYTSAMQTYQGPHIRIVGHSFGSQMAIILSKKVLDAIHQQQLPAHLLPHRLALLDPAYMGGNRLFLQQKTTSEAAYEYARELQDAGVLMETYRTSMMMAFTPFTDKAWPLLNTTAYTELPTWYIPIWDFQKKHVAAVWHYFWSYQFEPPSIRWSQAPGLSASTPDWRVQQLMNSRLKLLHVEGKFTKTPNRDVMMFWPK